jgi:hypothetical protein
MSFRKCTFAAVVLGFSVVPSIVSACTPYTGSCGGPGQISCSEANASYLACIAAQQQKPAGNVGPNNSVKENDPSVNKSRDVKR